MTTVTTTARPYANAAFEFALEKKDVVGWSNFLQTAAQVSLHDQVDALLKDPRVTDEKLVDLYLFVCEKLLDDHKKNFLLLLAENERANVRFRSVVGTTRK